jgi:hypothetical protein
MYASLFYVTKKQVDAQGLNVAKEAALGAIVDPVSLFIHQRSMLAMPAVQALATNPGELFGCLHSNPMQLASLSDI